MAGKLFVISGPSGVGKTTLVNAFLSIEDIHKQFRRVVTYTTRPAREHEVEGVDYHFISPDEFTRKDKDHFFLETTDFCGNRYGSPAFIIDPAARGETSFIFVVDQEGAKALRSLEGVVLIWIQPKNIEELVMRLEKRERNSFDVISKRLQKAQEQLECEERDRMYDYHVVNSDFQHALYELKSLLVSEIRGIRRPGN